MTTETDTTNTLGSYLPDVASSPLRQQQWQRLMAKLRSIYGEGYYQRCLVFLQPGYDLCEAEGIVVILRGARGKPEQIAQLQKRLLPLWQAEDSAVTAVRVLRDSKVSIADQVAGHQSLDSRFRFEKFITAEPNEFAYAASRRVAESVQALYNPLFLFGGVGLGKTHLMTAIALYRQQHFPEQKVLYLTAESFMRRFVQALRQREIMQFKQEFR